MLDIKRGVSYSEIIDYIKGNSKKVVGFGAGSLAIEAIARLQLQDRIECIIDNSPQKIGKYMLVGGNKIPIVAAEKELCTIGSDVIIIILSKYYKEMLSQCEQLINSSRVEVFVYADMKWQESLSERSLIKLERMLKQYDDIDSNEVQRILEDNRAEFIKNNTYVIPHITVTITDKCNLRCKECRALMPLMNKPKNVELNTIIKELTIILKAVDRVIAVDLLGGEPFLHPQLSEIINWIDNQDKISYIEIATNGTIVPNQDVITALKSKKVLVDISDYGNVVKAAKLIEILEENQIRFRIASDMEWFKVGGVEKRNRTADELSEMYLDCYCQYFAKYVNDNKLWVCPRAPRLATLGIVCDENDYEELLETDSKEETRRKIERVYSATYAAACDYCDQGNLHIESTKAGVQEKNQFFQSEYTLIKRKEYNNMQNYIVQHQMYSDN